MELRQTLEVCPVKRRDPVNVASHVLRLAPSAPKFLGCVPPDTVEHELKAFALGHPAILYRTLIAKVSLEPFAGRDLDENTDDMVPGVRLDGVDLRLCLLATAAPVLLYRGRLPTLTTTFGGWLDVMYTELHIAGSLFSISSPRSLLVAGTSFVEACLTNHDRENHLIVEKALGVKRTRTDKIRTHDGWLPVKRVVKPVFLTPTKAQLYAELVVT